MWEIGTVKRAAWEKMKLYYWPAFLAVFIMTVFEALFGGSHGNSGSPEGAAQAGSGASELADLVLRNQYASLAVSAFLLVGIIAFLLSVAAIFIRIFVLNPMEVGKARFFSESRAKCESAGAGRLFWAFGCGHYLNVVKILFLRDLYILLWTLLLIIPGIVKEYEYAMIPYILSENPEADSRDVFALTKDMMTGSKFQLFMLYLSFIGWYLLGMLGFGVVFAAVIRMGTLSYTSLAGYILTLLALLFIQPYVEASVAEVYGVLRRGINGFPFGGFGVPEVETEDVCEQQMNSGDGYNGGLRGEWEHRQERDAQNKDS